MNLKEKLARLERAAQVQKDRPVSDARSFDGLLPGKEHISPQGTCWLVRKRFDLTHRHGEIILKNVLENEASLLQYVTKKPAFADLQLERLIFVDTETTGLSGGVGTVAFMVGIGFFDSGQFVIEQYFMRDFSEERALLSEVLEKFRRCIAEGGALVSFNGKTYDIPLLTNRAIYHRLLEGPPEWDQVDLLHPARRLWKQFVPDCSLSTLETRILSVRRQGDVPGYLIPERYFAYLRSRDPRPLLPVFYHNEMDILSLVGLLHTVLSVFARKNEPARLPVDWLAMGSVFEEVRDYSTGEQFYADLLKREMPPAEKKSVLLRLANLHKRNRNYRKAIPLWQQALNFSGFSIEPYEELAKVYEHRLIDLAKAREYTLRALENVRLLGRLRESRLLQEMEERLRWRLQRLERKMRRSQSSN